jgi:hypothetical protein
MGGISMAIFDQRSDPRGNVAIVVREAEELLREHRPEGDPQTARLERLAEHFPQLDPLIPYSWFRYHNEAQRAISRLEQLLSYIESGGRIGQQWREQARNCAVALLGLYYRDAVAHLIRVANKAHALRLKRFDEQRVLSEGWQTQSLASEKAAIPQQVIDRALLLVSVMHKLGATPTGWAIARSPSAHAGSESALLLEFSAEVVEVACWKN